MILIMELNLFISHRKRNVKRGENTNYCRSISLCFNKFPRLRFIQCVIYIHSIDIVSMIHTHTQYIG